MSNIDKVFIIPVLGCSVKDVTNENYDAPINRRGLWGPTKAPYNVAIVGDIGNLITLRNIKAKVETNIQHKRTLKLKLKAIKAFLTNKE